METFELSVRKSPQYETFTKEQLLAKLQEARDLIQAKLDHNISIIKLIHDGKAGKADKYWHIWTYSHKTGDLKRAGWQSLNERNVMNELTEWKSGTCVPTGKWTTAEQKDVSEVNNAFRRYIELVDDFVRMVGRGKLRKSAWFPTLVVSKNKWNNEEEEQFITIGVPDIVECDLCGETIGNKSLSSHQQRATCKDKTRRKAIEANGYVQIGKGTKVYNLAKKGSVPSELIPIDYDAYVPKWVVQAAETYEKSGNKYAGMTLDEFIKRMGPDGNVNEANNP